MTILEDAYRETLASGGSTAIIRTLEITCSVWNAPVLICSGFRDQICGTEDGRLLTFIAANIGIALPQKNNKGNQALAFAVDNTTGEVQHKADQALDENARVVAIYRTYLSSDKSAPCARPYRMSVTSDSFQENVANLQCGFFDLIGVAWPRDSGTVSFFPGLRYL